MTNQGSRRGESYVASLLVSGILGAFSSSVSAQVQPDARGQAQSLETIEVTGSRLAASGFESPTPTTVLGADEMEMAAPSNLADMVNALPAFKATLTPASTSNNSNYGAGNYLDLRGLGPKRTLVLVDGRRFVPSSIYGFVNINLIPQVMVEQIDVVTGGASAAYGSDAVSGVVNFRLNDRMEGVKVVLQGGTSDHDDHQGYMASLAYGTSFATDRGRFVIGVEMADNSGVLRQDSRDWGAKGYRQITNPASTDTNDEPRRLIVPDVRTADSSYGGLITAGPLRGVQFGPGGQPMVFNFGTALSSTTMIGGDGVYSNANAVLETPLKRWSAFSRLTYQLGDSVQVFAELSSGASDSEYDLALPGVRVDTLTIQRDNAFLPEPIRADMVDLGLESFTMGRYSSDFAMARADVENETTRGAIGIEGSLGSSWKWAAYYTYGETTVDIFGRNNRLNANYTRAIDSVLDPVTGIPICRSTLAQPTDGCVPFNPFGPNSASEEAIAYVMGTAHRWWDLTQHAAALTFQGPAGSTWAGPVSIALGAEYRRETADVDADPRSIARQFGVGAQDPWDGEVDVSEAFAELLIPLVAGKRLADGVDLNLAARRTDYSTSGAVTTWKAGATWDVNDSFRLRLTRSRDIAAPALADLFQAPGQVASSVRDPVTNETQTLVTPTVGNPNLTPEKGDTTTVGLVWSPRSVSGLRASVDYYDIKIDDTITSLTAQAILDRCYSTQGSICDLVIRDTGGALTRIDVSPFNLQSLEIRGVDLEFDYRTALDTFWSGARGNFSLRGLATYIDKARLIDDGEVTVLEDSVQQPTIQGIGGQPNWRYTLRVGYDATPIRLGLTGRYIGGGRLNAAWTEKDSNILRVSGRFYTDLSLGWQHYNATGQGGELFLVVNNAFDVDPPITGGGFNTAATSRALYDQIGRTYTLGMRLRF